MTEMDKWRKEAIAGAQKLCGGTSHCICDYKCDHSNHSNEKLVPRVGSSEICPLAKYAVIPERNSEPWYRLPAYHFYPTENEMFSMCAMCENSTVKHQGSYYEVVPKDRLQCFDCPVYAYREYEGEVATEAACG